MEHIKFYLDNQNVYIKLNSFSYSQETQCS